MKLYEFFGVPHQSDDGKTDPRDELSGKTQNETDKLSDELYWFILDDDDLHKEEFMPLAQEISKEQNSKSFDHEETIKKWMPLVKKACMKFYKEREMTEAPDDAFPKDLRKGLCQRLADQHHKDIAAGQYKLD